MKFLDIFEFLSFDEGYLDCTIFKEVTFLKDFGVWKKNDKADYICLNVPLKRMAEFDDDYNVIKECKVTLIAEEKKD